MRILLVEDDKASALTLKDVLSPHFIVEVAHTGEEGEYRVHLNNYNLLILDHVLPDKSGIEICKNLRKEGFTLPILMLTGQTEIDKKVTALDEGADDYLTKPFNTRELLARIRALLRRHAPSKSSLLKVGDLAFDLNTKIATRNGKIIPLRRKEIYLLEFFMRNAGIVVTRQMILDHAWDSSNEPLTNTIDVHINYLRDKIDKPFEKKLIKTMRGIGYKMEA